MTAPSLHVSSVAEEKKDDGPSSSDPVQAVDDVANESSSKVPLGSRPNGVNSIKHKSKKPFVSQGFLLRLLRFIFMDLVVLAPLAVYCALQVLEHVKDNYLLKQMEMQYWSDEKKVDQITYYNRKCTPETLTAHDTPDLLIDPAAGVQAAVEKMMIHGASVYPNLLKPETAKELRDFIVKENKRTTDTIPVIEQDHRWSFPIQVDQHPSVAKALKEILSKDYLVDAIEGIMGPNPAVIEFTGITSAYGAAVQRMHQDVMPEASACKYSRNFIPSYSLFIPLQNTTKAMGATEVCPGTHQVVVDCNEVCEEEAFHVSGSADNWPMGFGALVNQQTTHRGPAHTGKGQPERVLFILTFAPRPRYEQKQVETRMLGSGGSYSLHWSQWGHTLRDFADPDRRMSYFWRHLKSLGIYKPWGHDWGWDYTSVASQRMVGEELGFNADDLRAEYKRGKFDWIPKFLHGSIPRTDDPVEAWTTFLIETMENVKDFARRRYLNFLFTYLAVFVGGDILLHMLGYISNSHVRAMQCIRRIALTHGVIVLWALLYYRSVTRGSWARNIERGIHLDGPGYNFGPPLPSTLPNEHDVMIFDDLQSPFLASTAFVYDFTHPGNYRWKNLTNSYAAGFDSLAPSLKTQLCGDLVKWQFAEHSSRILVKSDLFEWAVATEELADRICQKSLLSIDNHLKKYAIKWIDFLVSEVRFGFWRNSAMNSKHMAPWLYDLQDKVMGFQWPSPTKTDIIVGASNESSLPLFPFTISPVAVAPHMPDIRQKPRSIFPPELVPEEPFEGAWLQEGDTVEANCNGHSGGKCSTFSGVRPVAALLYHTISDTFFVSITEYYRAKLVSADADTLTWEVLYDDGEEATGLCPTCVRQFSPYQVGEKADCVSKGADFVSCQITAVNGEDSYEVKLENGRILFNVSASDLRRVPGAKASHSMAKGAISYHVGARVRAEFPGVDGIFPGVIHEVHGDDWFSIAYDDGDFSDEVHKSMIHA